MKSVYKGHLIARYRKQRGMTQLDLSRKLGVTPKAVSAWEVGRNEPNLSQAYDIAKALNIDIADLLQTPGKEEREKEETIMVLNAYKKADKLTQLMIKRLLKLETEYDSRANEILNQAIEN